MTDKVVITVVGGGTPFTYNLAAALERDIPQHKHVELRLAGRRSGSSRVVSQAIGYRWRNRSWISSASASLSAALVGSDVILHQARFGGHEERIRDEKLALSVNLAADETMGPAGVRAALRLKAPTEQLGREIGANAPHAITLVIANPLASTTRILAKTNPGIVLGLCEVPILTQMRLSASHNRERLVFDYQGLNHRGFHYLSQEFMPSIELPWSDIQQNQLIGGFPSKQYGSLLSNPTANLNNQRARRVAKISEDALRQMEATPRQPAQALTMRPTPWYELIIAPAIAGLLGFIDPILPINRLFDDLVVERYCQLRNGQVTDMKHNPGLPQRLRERLNHVVEHQRLLDIAVDDPSIASVSRALSADPLLPCDSKKVADQILTDLRLSN